jgi:hypothetical protein
VFGLLRVSEHWPLHEIEDHRGIYR